MTIDPETDTAAGPSDAKGHHIGAADEKNFEYGLECILDHADRLIDDGQQEAREDRAQALGSGRDAKRPDAQ